jgi:hypothetical protein
MGALRILEMAERSQGRDSVGPSEAEVKAERDGAFRHFGLMVRYSLLLTFTLLCHFELSCMYSGPIDGPVTSDTTLKDNYTMIIFCCNLQVVHG